MFSSKVKFTGSKIFQFLLKKDKKNARQFLRKLRKNLFIGLEVLRRKIFAQESANLMEKIQLAVGSIEIGMSTNIVPITLELVLIGCFPIGNSFIFKDAD